jgi:hypothetical protein
MHKAIYVYICFVTRHLHILATKLIHLIYETLRLGITFRLKTGIVQSV